MTGVLITTSHKPSQRTRSFAKDLSSIIPYSIVSTRGKKTLDELAIESHRYKCKYFLVIGEKKGNPSLIRIYMVDYTGKLPKPVHIASIVLRGVTLSRENPEAIKTYGVENIGFDIDKCYSDECFKLHDLLYSILKEHISNDPDIVLKLIDTGKHTMLKPVNRLGKTTGPVVRIAKVKIIEQYS